MSRFRRVFRIGRVEKDVDDELRFHFDMTVRELVRTGSSEDDARRIAERRFGDVEGTRARLEAIDREREYRTRRTEWWNALAQDLRHTLRGLRQRPGFTTVVVLTLALGVGANATMFGIIDRLLFRPPAFLPDPEHTHRVYAANTWDGVEHFSPNISYKHYVELTQWSTSFSQTVALTQMNMAIGAGDATSERQIGLVSASFWPFFGVRPALGRFFGPAEDKVPEGAPVTVLSHAYWQSRYAGGRDVLGQQLAIGRRLYTVIGVAPEGFSGIFQTGVVAFIPITLGVYDAFGGLPERMSTRWYTTYGMTWLEMLVRRKPGVSIAAATADLTSAYRRAYLSREGPHAPIEVQRPRAIVASILTERGPKQTSSAKVATWLVGVSVIVLLIACANVANLLLARALQRRREIAIRVALGVGRGRLLAQLLGESCVLGVLGAGAGLATAQWGGAALREAMLPQVEWGSALADARMLLFTGLAAITVGLLTGLAPALQARRSDVSAALKAGSREGTYHRSRLRVALLVAQAALSLVLLVGAGLFLRSLRNVRTVDLGYDADRVLFVLPEMRGVQLDSLRRIALHRELLERARTIPGVENAAQTVSVPFWMSWSEDLFAESRDSVRGDFALNAVSPSYFATMGTQVLRGRAFTDADVATAPHVIIVSQSMARQVWPNQDPLGKCLRLASETAPCGVVVGVVEDIVRGTFGDTPGLQYYMPTAQSGGSTGLFVRTRREAHGMTESVRRELQRVMPGVSYVTVRSLHEILDPNVRPWRLGATMFTLFGALALLIASIGLYSVIAYDVAQRGHELGVRLALGAQTRDILRLILSSGVRAALAGIAIGSAIALAAGKYVAPLLFNTSPADPIVFLLVALTLLSVAIAASFVPALRATKVDPNVALRSD